MGNENEEVRSFDLAPGSPQLQGAFPNLVGRYVHGFNLWKVVATLFPAEEEGGKEVVGLSLFFHGEPEEEPDLVVFLDLAMAHGLRNQLGEVCSWATNNPETASSQSQ